MNAKLRNLYGDVNLWVDPRCKELIGRAGKATVPQATAAIETAANYFPTWRDTPVERRDGAEAVLAVHEVPGLQRAIGEKCEPVVIAILEPLGVQVVIGL